MQGSLAQPGGSRAHPAFVVVVAAAVASGVALRFAAGSELWLDEALTVNVARLPLSELPAALRHDGAPPLFYVLLHGWIRLFGDSDAAVRALPGLLGVAALPLAWLAGRRIAGPRGAWIALVLVASSPFAVRYATEVRMYSLVVVLVLAGFLALDAALRRPTPLRLAAVAAVTGLLLLSHYWSLFLVVAVAAVLLPGARAPGGPHRRCLAALAAGGLALLPWLPVLAYQVRRTGTPWAARARPDDVAETLVQFAGGRTPAGALLAVVYAGLVVLALRSHRRRPAISLAAVAAGTLGGAFVFGLAAGAAFVPRYASIVLAPLLLLLVCGAAAVAPPSVRGVVLVVAAAAGVAGGVRAVGRDRTHAGEAAAAVRRAGAPGDVIAFCPDQLGPAVSRELGAGWASHSFPDGSNPDRVDWVDYGERMRAGDPAEFAAAVGADAGPDHSVFVVWQDGYRTLDRKCEQVVAQLDGVRRRQTVLTPRRGVGEPMHVERFGPTS